MEKVRIEIIYGKNLQKVAVNGVEMRDLTSIINKPVNDWFAPSEGRDGWEGLIPEIRKIVDDSEAELCFEFMGPSEEKRYLKIALPNGGWELQAINCPRKIL